MQSKQNIKDCTSKHQRSKKCLRIQKIDYEFKKVELVIEDELKHEPYASWLEHWASRGIIKIKEEKGFCLFRNSDKNNRRKNFSNCI